MRLRLPRTYAGFPVADAAPAAASRPQRSHRERGIAMMIAIITIAMMMVFSADLIVSSQVNLEQAVAHRDNLKAEYMARSAVNLGLFLISADFGLDLFLAGPQSPLGKQKPSDGRGDMWGLLNGLPIGGETVEMMTAAQESFGLNKINDSGVLDQLRQFDGEFILDVQDETSKVNINFAFQGRDPKKLVVAQLMALFGCPAERAFLEKRDLTPEELAWRVVDFIDKDKQAAPESGYGDENDPYYERQPRQRVKNAPLDTLDELRLVEGWDDEIHRVFSRHLTVFPFQEKSTDKSVINLNTTSKSLLACLVPEAMQTCDEKFLLATNTASTDRTNLVAEGQKIEDILKDVLCYSAEGAKGSENKSNWFSQRSDVFRMKTQGRVGNQVRKIEVVVQRKMPDKKKVLSAVKFLYWKAY